MRTSGTVLLLFVMVLFLPMATPVSAGLTAEQDGGGMFLSCRSDNDCVLTPTPVGEEAIGGQSSATTFQPETVVLEFEVDPTQSHIALLPDRLDRLELDVRQQTEAGGLLRPAVSIRLLLGPSVNDWTFSADLFPTSSSYEPHGLEDEPLDHTQGRVVWVNEPVRLIVEITLDRPGTWAVNMRGASFLEMDIPWSASPTEENVDEPSSATQPIETDFEDIHRGALVGADRDCWSFDVEEHEVLRLLVTWYDVPIELEQPHPVPDMINDLGRRAPAPEIITESDGETTQITYRWRALEPETYALCMFGSPDKFQPYAWSGVFGYEALGPTDPTGFTGRSLYPEGAGLVASVGEPLALQRQSVSLLLLCITGLGALLFLTSRPTTSTTLRYGAMVPGVLLLMVGGVIHPLVAVADEVQRDEEWLFEELVDQRLQQLWDVSAPGVPDQTLVTHTGATWGLLDGEQLQLRLDIETARPTEDGRWQLIVPQLEEFRLDQAIFGQIGQSSSTSADGMLEDQTVRFALLAGRSLLLDFMILEALLIVDEEPTSSVLHIDTTMVATTSTGSQTAPAWATRPSEISTNDWVLLQQSLFPERISVSLCDCDLDLMDVQFIGSEGFESSDVPQRWGLSSAQGLTPYGPVMATLGGTVVIVALVLEYRRFRHARELAYEMRPQPKRTWE